MLGTEVTVAPRMPTLRRAARGFFYSWDGRRLACRYELHCDDSGAAIRVLRGGVLVTERQYRHPSSAARAFRRFLSL